MTKSYWQKKNRPIRRDDSKIEIPARCDIAVIGGGITGIATAYFLNKFGCRDVVVLEKEYIGYGASGRNAGFLLAGLSEPYSRLTTGMGLESAKELMSATIVNHQLVAGAIKDNEIKCDYQKSGSYHLAMTEVEKREYSESAELLSRDGFEAVFIDNSEAIASGRLNGFSGGYFFPGDGKLDPLAFIGGLSRNLRVIEGFEVMKIGKKDSAVEIIGKSGKIKAEMAILATNGYSPLLDRFFDHLISPVRGQMMATSPLKGNRFGEEIYYANFGYDYFRYSIDNTLLIGGLRNRYFKDEVGYEDEINSPLQDDLARYAKTRLGVSEFEVAARWSGLMGDTIDGLPLVGALPHNSSVIVAAGYNGHGFGLGMIVARDLAKAVLGGEMSDILKKFSLKRFL
jgi:glycine/D-amino acid oxidase-like deaminating enzyme